MTDRITSQVVCSPEDILRRAGGLPAHTGFPLTDDLLAAFDALESRHPGALTSRRFGTSRLGEPLRVFTVHGGPLSHLIVGGVHPNEPIGSWTALHLAENLLTDDALREGLGATWHIIPTVDPDGLRLNEGWFDDPGDRSHYARGFYRPAPDEQVEWSFPTDYKGVYFDDMLPEAVGLMRLIDDVRPDLYVSLHNGEMGGVYYYLSEAEPELLEVLAAIPASLGLPLATGEPESPYLTEHAPAVFGMGTVADVYDYLESIGIDPAGHISGSSSSGYARRHGALALVAELPYWSHPASDDGTPIEESYADLVRRTAAELRAVGELLSGMLEAATPHLSLDTPFLRASRAFVPMLIGIAEMDTARAELPEAARPATVAERFDREDLVHGFKLRYGGMLLRAFEAETRAGLAGPALRRAAAELAVVYQGWLDEPHLAEDAEVIPIEKLVGVQYGAVLAAAATVRRTTA